MPTNLATEPRPLLSAGVTYPGETAFNDPCPPPEYYAANALPPPPTTQLHGDIRSDFVIIGGGFTGMSTAVHLGMLGLRSTIVENRSIGSGASSRNFGQVVPYLKHNPATLIAKLGAQQAERLIEQTGRGPDLVFNLIEKFGIACSSTRVGLIFALHSESGRKSLEQRTQYWQKRGAPVDLLDATATEQLIGSKYYSMSALDHRGGTINPLGYVRGLARVAIEMGCTVFTNSPVIKIQKTNDGWSVQTPNGLINAKRVILTTNGYTTSRIWSRLKDSIIPMRAYQVISDPLPQHIAQRILHQGHALTDTRHLFSGVRMYPDGRIHVGVDGPAFQSGKQAMLYKASDRIRKLFPDINDVQWRYEWSGWVAMTYDQIPHLHELEPGLWAGLGYSGRGIAHATMMGRDLAYAASDHSNAEKTFEVTSMKPRLTSRFARPLVGSLLNYYRLLDLLAERR